MNHVSMPSILYIDDEHSNRIVFEHSFKDKFPILPVGSAAAALDMLKHENIGVVVTDQRMPDIGGNELLERIKELYPMVVRVVITAYSDLDPILRAVNDGLVARYIVKPWDRQELEKILRWALEAYTLGQQSSALQLRLIQTERLVTLGSIGAAVIHDINQPLSYMLANTERLQSFTSAMPMLAELLKNPPADMPKNELQKLNDLQTELNDIVGDMLAGCRIMQGLTTSIRRLLRPSTNSGADTNNTDPVPIIRYALSVCQQIALNARAHLSYDGPTHLPKLRIGATELTQIMINLIANGAQALARRPEQHGTLLVTASSQNQLLTLIIQDNGPGMTADILARVGTPFFSTRPDGTGLGVAQCRRLVERAGGTFSITSEPNKGTTVVLQLPEAC